MSIFRETTRKLTGGIREYGKPDVRVGMHADGFPAVTIDLRGFNDTRTFKSVEELDELCAAIDAAAAWLWQTQNPLNLGSEYSE